MNMLYGAYIAGVELSRISIVDKSFKDEDVANFLSGIINKLKKILSDEFNFFEKNHPNDASKRVDQYKSAITSKEPEVESICNAIADIHKDLLAIQLNEQ